MWWERWTRSWTAGARVVDLGEVNGRVFVNNVSLGFYAQAVQREEYRDAKLRTLLETVPETLGPGGTGLGLRWLGPDQQEQDTAAAVLVSNNRYRLGRAVGSGTRPRIDDGLLGVTVIAAPSGTLRPWREWSTEEFDVESDEPVPAGVDGEALILDPPLQFRIRPRVLHVRIARGHPGASPSARTPDGAWEATVALVKTAVGREPAIDRQPARRGPTWT